MKEEKEEKVMIEKKKPVLPTLAKMEVGDTESFPASRTNSVKSMCTLFGFQEDKKFSTTMNRVTRTVDVTRKK